MGFPAASSHQRRGTPHRHGLRYMRMVDKKSLWLEGYQKPLGCTPACIDRYAIAALQLTAVACAEPEKGHRVD